MKAKKIIIGVIALVALLITIAGALAAPNATYSPNTDVNMLNNQSQLFSVNVSDPNVTFGYQWKVGNAIVGSNAPTFTFNGANNVGSHFVSVAVTGNQFFETYIWAVTVQEAQPTSLLSITKVKVNGKTNGKLSTSDLNEIEVEVSNDYDKKIEDITVTVRILDVDGDDLEEEADISKISDGDKDTVTVEFDLSNEDLDEDEYTLEIEVEGEATDNTDHSDLETQQVKVDREKDDIVITKVDLQDSQVVCSALQTSLDVDIKNVGENNQEGAKVTVKNSALGMNLQKANIDLDDYSGSDNDYQATFTLDLEDAKQGTYTLDVAVYSEDNDQMDSKEVELQIVCDTETVSKEESKSTEYYADKELAAELQKKLDEYKALQESQAVAQQGNFRESNSYVLLLGALVAMMFFAAVLTATYLLVKKK